jgi:5-methyltetrahydropteroyltriglutamate--homocysteine methyltransferase
MYPSDGSAFSSAWNRRFNVRPAYRADQVGSFLRPQAVKDAHTAFTQGQLPLDKLRELEDRAVLDVLELQRQVGIDVYSDGEFRRGGWSGDFVDAVDGFVSGAPAVSVFNTARGNNPSAQTGGPARRIIGARLHPRHRLTEHEASFLRAHASGPYKMTMPAASYVLARGYRPDITDPVYGSRAAALHDVAGIIRSEIMALVDEGVPYVQLDNPHYPDYVVEERNAQWRSVGVDPTAALRDDIDADNFTVDGLARDGLVLAMHLCRGNGGRGPDQPAGWHTAGGYDAIAEQVFGGLHVDRFLLEYDSERAGGFEPLRFVPRGKTVVLGLVTTKSGELESQELLLRRIEEAARYLPLENLALSPQCGFASTMAGNPLTEDEERRKLELVVRTARQVWG